MILLCNNCGREKAINGHGEVNEIDDICSGSTDGMTRLSFLWGRHTIQIIFPLFGLQLRQ